MIGKTAERIWGAALLMLNPGELVDKFLDWVEDLSATMVPAQVCVIANNETRSEALLDPLSA